MRWTSEKRVAAPGKVDGNWIAHPSFPGRAVGNLRQPNHLSSLLLWATIGVLWLSESGAIKRWVGTLLATLLLFAIVLSASRTGAVSVGMLAVWGLLDRRLSRHARALLLMSPVVYAASIERYALLAGINGREAHSVEALGRVCKFEPTIN